MIYTVTLNPALDRTIVLPDFSIGKVNRVAESRVDAGGKGINVSKVIRLLGGESVAMGILGGRTGEVIRRTMEDAGIQCDFLPVPCETRTNLKIIDPKNNTNTDINEAGAPIDPPTLRAFEDRLFSAVRGGDWVVLAGHAQPGVEDTLFRDWILKLKEKRVKVFLDADGGMLRQSLTAAPYLAKPNEDELSALMNRPMETDTQIRNAAEAILAVGVERVVISRGGKGAVFVSREEILTARALRVQVMSTVGAGDAMVAALCLGESRGQNYRESAATAMAVSAASVTCTGTQPPEINLIQTLRGQVEMLTETRKPS